jgi:V/A-type H+-transporting ATPase subunit C
MKKRYDQLEYAYAVGRIRVLETKLLGKSDYEKLIASSSKEEAARMLTDFGWPAADSPDRMIHLETAALFQLISSLGGDAFLDTQRIQYDYHNIRVLLKSELTGQQAEDLLLDWGTIPADRMEEAVTRRDDHILTQRMKAGIEEALEQYARIPDPSLLDVTLDRYALEDLLESAQKQPDPFVEQMIRMQIDCYNIKTFVRIKKMGRDRAFLSKALVDGGTLDRAFFTSIDGAPADQLGEVFSKTEYAAAFEGGEPLEPALGRLFSQRAAQKRTEPFGLAPVAGYFWAKETEISNVRMILTCIEGGIPADKIRRRLRGI